MFFKKKITDPAAPSACAGLSTLRISFSGNREVTVEGCRGVVEYTEESVKLNTGKYLVGFSGRGLQLRNMNEYDLIIDGFIISMEFIM